MTGETLRSWVRQAGEHMGREYGRGEQSAESRDEEVARLRAENGRLRKAEKEWELGSRVFCPGGEVKTCRWDFISKNRADFGVQRICRVLQVSRSGYYRWIADAQARAERQAADEALVSEIREVHSEHQGTYGVRRVRFGALDTR